MSFIAALGVDAFPAVFGTLPAPAVSPDASPSIATVSGLGKASPAAVVTTSQKLALLGGNCVIAWEGNAAVAHSVIAELRGFASKASLSMPIIDACFSQLDAAVKEEVSFVGWVKEGELFRQFWYRADVAQGEMFGQMSAAGSGATDFVKGASQISGGILNVIGGLPAGLTRAVSSMLSASSLMARAELAAQGNVTNPFHGAYEIATYVGDRFAKLDDLTWVFWTAGITGGQIALDGPRAILKQDYAGDSLLMRVLQIQGGDGATDPPMVQETRQVILPFGQQADFPDAGAISWPAPEASFTCHVVLVRSPQGATMVNRIEFSPSRTPRSIRFSSSDGHTRFDVAEEFREELVQSARDAFVDLLS